MNRITILIFVCFLFVPAGVFAAGPAGGTLSISASQSGFYQPDTAEVGLTVETTQKSADKAAVENARISQKLLGTLKSLINEKAGDSLNTSGYSLQPVYKWDDTQKKSILTGYMATNGIMVKIHKLDQIGRLIDEAIAAGANRVESINFSIANETKDCGQVITEAGAKARAEAQALALSLGVKLGRVKSASTSCGAYQPAFRGEMMLAAKAQKEQTPIEAGQTRLNASVDITFHIR
ncbi:MAG: SIMPL domain-containing protein [Actinomycetota bacterium]|nr:SIMPL domain-containing protein [Actinomycetota bacterium]